MAATTVSDGMMLFLRPEDVTQAVEAGFYATVISTNGTEVFVEPTDDGEAISSESIPLSTALARIVPDEEPTGSRSGALLRQGVACSIDDDVCFGQVVATSHLGVQVNLAYGTLWLERKDIITTVSPLFAMLMYEVAEAPDRWTDAAIRDADVRMTKCLDDAVSCCPAMEQVMDVIDQLAQRTPKGMVREWCDARTGATGSTTTDHALLYTYYVIGNRSIPTFFRPAIGNSIVADPARLTAAAGGSGRGKSKRMRTNSSYLASETSYDDATEEKGDGPPAFSFTAALAEATGTTVLPAQPTRTRANHAVELPRASRMRLAPPASAVSSSRDDTTARFGRPTVSPAQAVATLQSRLTGDPELQALLQVATNRPASGLDDDDGRQRGKHIYRPTNGERLVHDAMTAAAYQGTSPHGFVYRLVASPAVQFFPYPAVLIHLYVFAFGPRGLSIMHLASVTLFDRMALQENNPVNMMDFGASVALPPARKPTSWVAVQDAVNGLVAYCNAFADPLTVRVASAVAGFLSVLQSQCAWPEEQLEGLVYWINERLFAYRGLVDQYAHEGVGDPTAALAWFSPSNPGLGSLQATMLRREFVAFREAKETPTSHNSTRRNQHASAADQAPSTRVALSTNVKNLIPKKHGNELCLRYASSKGCKYNGDTCGQDPIRGHFVEKLPRPVRAYVISKFGGLSSEYSAQN